MSKLAIYADNTTVYSCLGKTNDVFDKVEMAAKLEVDLCTVVEWGDKWLVTFNASKTKLLSMNRFKDPFLPSIVMNGAELPENKHFRLLGLTFSNDLTWNNYIESIAKSAAMKIGSLYRARNFLSPESILYLYKATIRPCLESAVIFGLVLLLIVLVCLTAYRGELLTLLDLIFAQIYSPYLIAVMLHHCLYFINTSMVVVLTN